MKENCDVCGQTSADLIDCHNPHCKNVVCAECRVESGKDHLCKPCETKVRKVSTSWKRNKKIRDSLLRP